jgi:hypothetical protein
VVAWEIIAEFVGVWSDVVRIFVSKLRQIIVVAIVKEAFVRMILETICTSIKFAIFNIPTGMYAMATNPFSTHTAITFSYADRVSPCGIILYPLIAITTQSVVLVDTILAKFLAIDIVDIAT